MNRFAKFTLAAAALSLTALSAVPASAADVTVSLKGKSGQQISADLRAAASKVCREEISRSPMISLNTCIDVVFDDAVSQLPAKVVLPAS